jgi:hypothetical protein
MIDEAARRALFFEMHAAIEETAAELSAEAGIEALQASFQRLGAQLLYPPGTELSPVEWEALRDALRPGDASAAFRKLLAHACAQPLFQLLCVIDGVAAPRAYTGEWSGLTLSPATEEDEQPGVAFLHDDFGETYFEHGERTRG